MSSRRGKSPAGDKVPGKLMAAGKGAKGRSKSPVASKGTKTPVPEIVHFKAYIRNIFDVSTLDQSFGIDVWIAAWSCEENRATTVFQKAHDGDLDSDDIIFDSHSSYGEQRPCWHLNLQNAKNVQYIYREKNMPTVRVFPDGGGSFERQHIHCTVINNLKLEEFPFDTQIFELTVSLDVSNALAKFAQPDPTKENSLDGDTNISKDSASEKMLDETEWHSATSKFTKAGQWVFGAVAHCVHVNEKYSGGDGYSRLKMQIPVQRNPSSHFYTLMVPLFIVTTSAFYAFFIPQINIGERLSYLSTLLLTVFAFKWSAAEKLPKTKRLSFIMELFQNAYIFISIVMAAGCVGQRYEVGAECLVVISYAYMMWHILLKYRNSAKKRRSNENFQRKVQGRDVPVSIHDAIRVKEGEPGYVEGEDVYVYSITHNGSIFFHVIDFVFSNTFLWLPLSVYLFAILLALLYVVVVDVDRITTESKRMAGQCASYFGDKLWNILSGLHIKLPPSMEQVRTSVETILNNRAAK